MRHAAKAAAIIALMLLADFSFLPSQESPAAKPGLSLKECMIQALANNLSLSVEAFNPGIQDAAVALTREQFLPQLQAGYNKQSETSLGVWGLQGTSFPSTMNRNTFTLTEKAVTGTTAMLQVYNYSATSGQKYVLINPQYYSYLELSITQPLLRGFGPKINRAQTYQAERQKEIATAALKTRVLQTLYETEQAYWNLYNDVENVKVQESSLIQSREVLKRAKEGERIGNQSAIDVLNAETAAAGWEDGLVSARLQVEQSESTLRKIMDLPPTALNATDRMNLADKPSVEKVGITYNQALAAALTHNPEVIQAEKQIAINANQVGFEKNQVLPQLDLTLSGWSPGQSGVKFLYSNDDPINGTVIGSVVGSRWDALKQALKLQYKSWSASINLTLPLADIFSRAALTQAKLQQRQSAAALETQRQTVAFAIADAMKQLRNAELRIQSSSANRTLQEKRLAAEMQRYQLGLVGSQWVFEYQRQLATARSNEVQALTAYRIAAARLKQIMGTTLETEALKFRDMVFE